MEAKRQRALAEKRAVHDESSEQPQPGLYEQPVELYQEVIAPTDR
jgi:hypothetical protein